MVGLFWISLAFIAYVYVGYVAILYWRARRPAPRARLDASPGAAAMPAVSIVLAVRNEGPRLAARLDNLLTLDYPSSLRQIIVVSDGSTDDTLAVLRRYGAAVDVVVVDAGGKALALNAGVARARFDILVFADARQAFASDALSALVAPFADPHVGAVSGELVLDCETTGPSTSADDGALRSTIADGVGLYWRYEKQIRRLESAIASTLGATGAIYAMRRSLWRPLAPQTILDDVLAPMRCVLAGYRVVVSEKALAYDRTAADAGAEAARKIRTLAGNYQLLWLEPRVLLPWRNPVWWQFVSHKLGRLVVPYALAALALSSAALAGRSILYAAAFSAQCLFYLLAAYGADLNQRGAALPEGDKRHPAPVARAARVAFTFLVLNGSAVAGLAAVLMGRKVWR